jgi:hypothetical protein
MTLQGLAKTVLTAYCLVFSSLSYSSVLIEACKAITDAERRAACFEELAKRTQDPAKPMKFQDARKSLTRIQSGISVGGLSYAEYSRLLQELVTEVTTTKPDVKTTEEKAVYEKFTKIIEIHEDAVDFLADWHRFFSIGRNASLYGSVIPIAEIRRPDYLQRAYSPSTVGIGLGGTIKAVSRSEMLRSIWRMAAREENELNELLDKK